MGPDWFRLGIHALVGKVSIDQSRLSVALFACRKQTTCVKSKRGRTYRAKCNLGTHWFPGMSFYSLFIVKLFFICETVWSQNFILASWAANWTVNNDRHTETEVLARILSIIRTSNGCTGSPMKHWLLPPERKMLLDDNWFVLRLSSRQLMSHWFTVPYTLFARHQKGLSCPKNDVAVCWKCSLVQED